MVSVQKQRISQLSPTLAEKVISIDERGLTSADWVVYNNGTKRIRYSSAPTSDITAETVLVDGFTLSQKDTAGITTTCPLAIRKDGTWFAYGWDLTKNVCEVFGSAGYIRTAYTYSPYGEVSTAGDVIQPIQWSSEYYDTELGMVYYNYRHYNPVIGSWICREALGENESSHLYSYLHNKPFYVDILGWKKWTEGPSGDSYRDDPFGHGRNSDGTPRDPHIDRKPSSGGTQYRYDLDGTPRDKAPKIPKKDIPLFKKLAKKCLKFGTKKLPGIGLLLTIKGAFDGYQEGGFLGAVEGAIW